VGVGDGVGVGVGVGVGLGVLVGAMVGVAVAGGVGVGVTVGTGDGVVGLALMLADGRALFDGLTVVSPPQLTELSVTKLMAVMTAAARQDRLRNDERHMVTLPGTAAPES
jgi:hypothetical protein